MTAGRSYLSILFALTLGGAYAASAPACVIQATDCDECGEASVCDSHVGSDGECYCDPGHVWADPNDPNNYDCDRIPPKPDVNACNNPHNVQVGSDCFCACGYTWQDPNDASNLTCVPDSSSDCQESDTDVLVTTDELTGDSSESGYYTTGSTGYWETSGSTYWETSGSSDGSDSGGSSGGGSSSGG